MAIKMGDKVIFNTDSMAANDNYVHIVRNIQCEEGYAPDIVIACSCDHFAEDYDVTKVDNEESITCPDCIERLIDM